MNEKEKNSRATGAADLELSLDVGHSSIGWAVLQNSAAATPVPVKNPTKDTRMTSAARNDGKN